MNIEKRENLTAAVKNIIQEAIQNTGSSNRFELCQEVGRILEERYLSKGEERIIGRMDLGSTDNILKKIDAYMIDVIAEEIRKREL